MLFIIFIEVWYTSKGIYVGVRRWDVMEEHDQ